MSKRGYGEGSISKRRDGRWVARISVGGGRRKAYYGATRAEVAARLVKELRAHSRASRRVAIA